MQSGDRKITLIFVAGHGGAAAPHEPASGARGRAPDALMRLDFLTERHAQQRAPRSGEKIGSGACRTRRRARLVPLIYPISILIYPSLSISILLIFLSYFIALRIDFFCS